jgi:hypothetical protein
MPVSYPRKVIEAEVVDPAALTLPLRDAVLQDIYHVHKKIFKGVSFEEFTHDVGRPEAPRTRIQLYRSEGGELVGFCAVHLLETRSGGRLRAVLRAEAGLLPDYRGSANTLWFGAKEAFRYKLLHPLRPVVLFATSVHPSSYHLISSYLWQCYPDPLRPTPEHWRKLLVELAENSEMKAIDPEDPLIRDAGWITRDGPAEVENWRNSPFEDVKYFLSRNPGYPEGHGLAMIAPLSAGNLVISFALYVFEALKHWLCNRLNFAGGPKDHQT